MYRVGEFEKVSYEQFCQALADHEGKTISNDESTHVFHGMSMRSIYEALELPTRATAGSAGYDFRAPFAFTLKPGESIKIPTGIRVRIDDGWWLGCSRAAGWGSSIGSNWTIQWVS